MIMAKAVAASEGQDVLSGAGYLTLTYDEARLPRTAYPRKLAAFIASKFMAKPGRLLDVGCGRGEFLTAFADLGFETAGIDISPAAPGLSPQHEVAVVDLERNQAPFAPGTFDYMFSKSVLEHTRHPVQVLHNASRCLKPGGLAVVMVPAWETGYSGSFYIDHTHITPFTLPALEDAMTLAGFEVLHGQLFYQLPFLWSRPWLAPARWLFAILPLPYRPMNKTAPWPAGFNKMLWFSKEAMLLVVGRLK
jgi:SAM-dependent methyltransferase